MILVQFFRAMWMKIALGKKKSCVSANNLEKNIVGRQDRLFSSLCLWHGELKITSLIYSPAMSWSGRSKETMGYMWVTLYHA